MLLQYPTDVVRLRYAVVRNTLVDIFHRHGAVPLSTPLLMPPQKLYALEDQYVQVMDHGGGLVALPYDLRVSRKSSATCLLFRNNH